jgi:hypothetical protein
MVWLAAEGFVAFGLRSASLNWFFFEELFRGGFFERREVERVTHELVSEDREIEQVSEALESSDSKKDFVAEGFFSWLEGRSLYHSRWSPGATPVPKGTGGVFRILNVSAAG